MNGRLPGSFEVQPLRATDAPAAALLLGRAFSENPVARAALSHCTVESRLARVTRLNRGLVDATLRAGDADAVYEGSTVLGVSLSFAPGDWPLPMRAFLSMARGALGCGVRGALRYSAYGEAVDPFHPREKHVYLFVLGVEPSAQGRGVGGALLTALSARADQAQLPIHLETDKPSSVRLYEKHGFVVTRYAHVAPLDGIETWWMLRAPR